MELDASAGVDVSAKRVTLPFAHDAAPSSRVRTGPRSGRWASDPSTVRPRASSLGECEGHWFCAQCDAGAAKILRFV